MPAPTLAGGSASFSAVPRGGLPWDQRQAKGLFHAFIETLQMILSRPNDAFNAMKREGGFGEPLLYLLIGGSFGFVIYFIYRLVFHSLGMFALGTLGNDRDPFFYLIGMGVGGFIFLIFVPVLIVISAFINSAILHVCLMIVGGAKQSFETTFRVARSLRSWSYRFAVFLSWLFGVSFFVVSDSRVLTKPIPVERSWQFFCRWLFAAEA